MSRKDKIVGRLNELYNLNVSAAHRFEEVAGHLYDLELKRICFENAETRKRFYKEINEVIKAYGGTSKSYFTTDTDVHNLWSDFKFLAGGLTSTTQFYEELSHYTIITVEAYQDVISDPTIPSETVKMLRSHWGNLHTLSRVLKNSTLMMA